MTFDRIIAVDFSAASRPVTGANSLWVATAEHQRPVRSVNVATRVRLADLLTSLVSREGRSLVIFDVALGWPSGFARAIGCRPPLRTRSLDVLDDLLVDDDDNANNRFDVADELNRRAGAALFWGHPVGRHYENLSATTSPPTHLRERPFDHRRLIEHDIGGSIKSPMQLSGVGAVGGQSLVAQVFLRRLVARWGPFAVWPFEAPTSRVVVGEYFFSLAPWRREVGACVDDRQVRAVARQVRSVLERGEPVVDDGLLASLSPHERRRVCTEEGWLVAWPAHSRASVRQRTKGA